MRESRVVFGTAALGLPYGLGREGNAPALMPEDAARALVDDALHQGVVTFDTAPAYGEAEVRLGKALEGRAVVWTKVGHDVTGDDIDAKVEATLTTSLERLRRPTVDLLQWHNCTAARIESRPFRDAWERLRTDERVRSLGATTYGVEDARAAVGSGLFSVVQVEWNILNQSVVEAVGGEASRRGVRIAVRSVFLQGALTDDARDLPSDPALHAAVGRARSLAVDLGISLQDLALRAAFTNEAIAHVLVGIDRPGQLAAAVEIEARPALDTTAVRRVAALDLHGDRSTDPRHWRR